MTEQVTQLVENLQGLLSTEDVAVEYEDVIGGRVKFPHHEIVSGGVLMMSILDARYAMYRLKQFINLSDAGELIKLDDTEKNHMSYLKTAYSQISSNKEAIASALEEVVKNKVLVSEGKPVVEENTEPVEPLLNEQLDDIGRKSRIAIATAETIRKGRN